ncbi:MAG: O-antigen ligase family protein [Candidatus Omnitrophota bacterium]|nr:O-antigen ligase family protein [Candidatus Omnitrophota bacterium]
MRIIKFVFLFFALTDFFSGNKKLLGRTFWVIVGISCFTFFNGIFQSVFNFDMVRHNEIALTDKLHRISGSFAHPNDFAAYIIAILPISLCFLCPYFKKNHRAFIAINCILGAYCLIRTSSRGAWVAFLLGMIVYFYFYNKKISVIIPLAIISVVMLSPHGFDRIKGLFAFEQNTVWERTQLWKGTWEMIKVHPFFGFGVNTFSRYFPIYKPSEYWGIMYSHNSYLQMWSEIGIFGLAAFLSAIFIVVKQTVRDLRKKIKSGVEGFILLGALAGYVAFLIQSGLDTNLFSLRLTTLFWVMTAYIVSLNKFLEEKI